MNEMILTSVGVLGCGAIVAYVIYASGRYTAKQREFFSEELLPLVQTMRLLHAQDLEVLHLLASEAAMGRSPAALLDVPEGHVDVSGHKLLDSEAAQLLTDPRCLETDRTLLEAVRYYFDFGKTVAPNGWTPGREAISEVRTIGVYDYIRVFEAQLTEKNMLDGRRQVVRTCVAELKRRMDHIEELCNVVQWRRGIEGALGEPQGAIK